MRLRVFLISLMVLVLGFVGVVWYVLSRPLPKVPPLVLPPSCTVETATGTVTLDTIQIANAATIAAVGIRRAMPDQGIVIALATAMQESKLENLDGGDRDSIGLFQQRPSQGWGTPENIADPRYAAVGFDVGDAIYEPAGCESCGGAGYRGRLGIFEVLELTPEIRPLIQGATDAAVIDRAAIQTGMTTMLDDGVAKCRSGATSVAEILRVTTVR